MNDMPKPEPTKPITFDTRAGLMGGVTLTTDNAHELAAPDCVGCCGTGLRCSEEAESLTDYYRQSELPENGGRLCAGCGCDRADHAYCPLCILRVREQFDHANQ